jgi:hypothetical protein
VSVKANLHRAVVVIEFEEVVPNLELGFPTVAKAIEFLENQLNPNDKLIVNLTEALTDGLTIGRASYQILDIDSYLDIYTDDEGDDDEEDDE